MTWPTARQALKSRTIGINLFLGALLPFLKACGVEIPPDIASTGLVLINMALRLITNESLSEK